MFSHPLLLAGAVWEQWRRATCLPDDCFCEAIRESLVRQPSNTWSSMGFVLAALWALTRSVRRDCADPPALSRAATRLFVAALVLVGLGSAFYHASLTFVGQVIDVSGMYLIATFILLHRIGPRWRIPPLSGVLVFVFANAALMVAQVTTPAVRRVVFALLLVTALGVEWRTSRAGRAWLATGAGLMALAFSVWMVDRQRIVCTPESLLQGHAIWHVLGALAAACLYRNYEREADAKHP